MVAYPQPMAITEKVRRLAESYAELSDDERREFVGLVVPLDERTISKEWLEELRSRAADIDQGRVSLVDGDDFLRRLRAV